VVVETEEETRMKAVIEECVLDLVRADITLETTDAIVNAANPTLLGGGGVDGAIHRSGGPEILDACKEIVAHQGSLATGAAVITAAGRLKARFVIHTVGPVWQGGASGEAELLARCYRSCLALARQRELSTVALPSISTGAYGYPLRQASRIAIDTVTHELAEHPAALSLVRFVLFDETTLGAYMDALTRLRTVEIKPD
jgi:O-acetyl-ADP-ribose deacetylase (regulator of RNase III)